MIMDKLKRSKSDTDVSGSTNRPDRLRRLRSLHHFVPSGNPQGTIADNRPKANDAARQRDIDSILQKAKPKLSPEAKTILKTIKDFIENSENKPSEDEYKNAIEKALGTLSPETLADYKKYGIEFVLNKDMSYPTTRRTKEGKWELNLPAKYEYPIQSMIYRCMDDLLKMGFVYAREKAQVSKSQAEIVTKEMLEKRIEITARVFQTNMLLGKEYGWKIGGRAFWSTRLSAKACQVAIVGHFWDEQNNG